MKTKAKSRLTRKQVNEYKSGNAKGEPASLGAAFVCDRINMINAFNWYNENKEVKNLRKFVEQYAAKKFSKKNAEILKRSTDKEITITMCAIAKLILGGCKIDKEYVDHLNGKIDILVKKYIADKDILSDELIISYNDYVRPIADVEDFLDEFYRSEYKSLPIDFYKYLIDNVIKPGEVRQVIAYYQPLLEELENEDTNLTKNQLTSYKNFVSKIIDDSTTYLSNNRKQTKLRKPRRKKVKTADQLVSRVKFKESDTALKITSINPTNILSSQSVWLYNTKYKRMTYLCCSEGKFLSIKGTTILGFDPNLSVTKTIRKPEITLPDLINSSKIAMVKNFKALKTKEAVAKGRINEDVLILKVIK